MNLQKIKSLEVGVQFIAHIIFPHPSITIIYPSGTETTPVMPDNLEKIVTLLHLEKSIFCGASSIIRLCEAPSTYKVFSYHST